MDAEAEPTQDVNNLPSTILSQQQYFHQLFDLLTFNETIGKKVWDLLMLLPTNRHMLEELSELSTHPAAPYGTANGTVEGGAVKWEEILDPSSTFKLLYSLQIVDSLLLPNMTYVCLHLPLFPIFTLTCHLSFSLFLASYLGLISLSPLFFLVLFLFPFYFPQLIVK